MVLTFFFAQFLVLMMIVVSISMLLQRPMYMSLMAGFRENRASLYGASLLALILGSFIVLMHNVWNGGFLPVLVTLFGWMIFLKGAALLILPSATLERMMRPAHARRAYVAIAVVVLIIGMYLFLAGSGGR
jgi:hypothetical protein